MLALQVDHSLRGRHSARRPRLFSPHGQKKYKKADAVNHAIGFDKHVPGTSLLNDPGSNTESSGVDPSHLKHDESGEIALIPQPSDSPNDPYNWPKWKKELLMAAVLYGCGCVGGKHSSGHSLYDGCSRVQKGYNL